MREEAGRASEEGMEGGERERERDVLCISSGILTTQLISKIFLKLKSTKN